MNILHRLYTIFVIDIRKLIVLSGILMPSNCNYIRTTPPKLSGIEIQFKKCSEFDEKYEKVFYADEHDLTKYDAKEKLIYSILYNMLYEGGLSQDKNDSGNYYQNNFCGTKYGVSAAFALNKISCDSLKNITRKDACKIIYDYIYTDYLENKTLSFIMYYTLSCFFIGKENAELYLLKSLNYQGEINRKTVDSMISNIKQFHFVNFAGVLIFNSLKNKIDRLTKNPRYAIYKNGWYKKLYGIHKHIIVIRRYNCSDIAYYKILNE